MRVTHEDDQVIVARGPSSMSLAIAGQPAKTSWSRGDVMIIPRGAGHQSKNGSGMPVDFILVAIRRRARVSVDRLARRAPRVH